MSYDSGSESDHEREPTLAEMRAGREPVWTLEPHGAPDISHPTYTKVCKVVRCTKHLPESAKGMLEVDPDRDDPQWFPPQHIMTNAGWWSDHLTCVTMAFDSQTGRWLGYGDNRPCSVCAFQEGINKVRAAIYKRKFLRVLEENWMTPKSDGHCGYAEWTWKKMKEDLESNGVHF